jgi:hypothetical protein
MSDMVMVLPSMAGFSKFQRRTRKSLISPRPENPVNAKFTSA